MITDLTDYDSAPKTAEQRQKLFQDMIVRWLIFNNANNAIEYQKKFYDNQCVVTGAHRDAIRLDGCHIFERDQFPAIISLPDNIVPLNSFAHNQNQDSLDWVEVNKKERGPFEKIEWLVDKVNADHRADVKKQLWRLLRIVNFYYPNLHALDQVEIDVELVPQ